LIKGPPLVQYWARAFYQGVEGVKKVNDPYKDFLKVPGTEKMMAGFSYSDGGTSAAAMEAFMSKEPKTKEQFLNRMLMSDFSGDIRDLAADRNIQIKRASANVLDLTFLASGQHFQLVIRKPALA